MSKFLQRKLRYRVRLPPSLVSRNFARGWGALYKLKSPKEMTPYGVMQTILMGMSVSTISCCSCFVRSNKKMKKAPEESTSRALYILVFKHLAASMEWQNSSKILTLTSSMFHHFIGRKILGTLYFTATRQRSYNPKCIRSNAPDITGKRIFFIREQQPSIKE